MKNVFIVGGGLEYKAMFLQAGFAIISDMEQADLICFTGGEDVSPHLYDEEAHPQTYNNLLRDAVEKKMFHRAFELDIPMVGICRGGQFLNVMSGGKMYQHVTNHCRGHYLIDVLSGKHIFVTSTHHQMMRAGPGGEVIAIANEHGTKEHMSGNAITFAKDNEPDTEVVFYPTTDCLCFQPHPEFNIVNSEGMREYFFSLLKRCLSIEV